MLYKPTSKVPHRQQKQSAVPLVDNNQTRLLAYGFVKVISKSHKDQEAESWTAVGALSPLHLS